MSTGLKKKKKETTNVESVHFGDVSLSQHSGHMGLASEVPEIGGKALPQK